MKQSAEGRDGCDEASVSVDARARSWAGGVGGRKLGAAAAIGRVAEVGQASAASGGRSRVLGLAVASMAALEGRAGHCQAGERAQMAPSRIQALLALEVVAREARSAKSGCGSPSAYPAYVAGKSHLGRAAKSVRTRSLSENLEESSTGNPAVMKAAENRE